jgi:hypothetical protein
MDAPFIISEQDVPVLIVGAVGENIYPFMAPSPFPIFDQHAPTEFEINLAGTDIRSARIADIPIPNQKSKSRLCALAEQGDASGAANIGAAGRQKKTARAATNSPRKIRMVID